MAFLNQASAAAVAAVCVCVWSKALTEGEHAAKMPQMSGSTRGRILPNWSRLGQRLIWGGLPTAAGIRFGSDSVGLVGIGAKMRAASGNFMSSFRRRFILNKLTT
jgi:hypothetical protein